MSRSALSYLYRLCSVSSPPSLWSKPRTRSMLQSHRIGLSAESKICGVMPEFLYVPNELAKLRSSCLCVRAQKPGSSVLGITYPLFRAGRFFAS